ncbi:MAG TPA: hypothetical protein VN176_08675 [Verrucomicrobiae bacterium]|jgi:hypothetical protein|nr:hypothetical protein [Verrucomicrobiae bacterium]
MSNYLFVLWIAMAAALLLLLVSAAIVNLRRRCAPQMGPDVVISLLLPVDTDALSGLLDQQREHPSSRTALSEIQRERARSTRECLRRMASNAALLQRIGYSHLQSENQLIASLAQEMVDAGVSVRMYAFVGLVRLRLWMIFRLGMPFLVTSPDLQSLLSTGLLPAYEVLKLKAGNLTALKYSGLNEALNQGL